MTKKFSIAILLFAAVFVVGCSTAEDHANTNANPATEATSRTASDNSQITTSVDASGTKTETRTFKNNPHVSKVVVTTTKEGKRTVKVYSPSGQEKEVTGSDSDNILEATGDKVAGAAGWTADKAEDVGSATKKEGEKVADKTVDTAKDASKKVADTTKSVGEAAVSGTKTVGEKTASGTKAVVKGAETGVKKAGSAVKKVIP